MAHVSFISATKLAELLNAANSQRDMHIRVLTANQLALGIDPLHPTSVIDLSKEIIAPYSPRESPTSLVAAAPEPKSTPTHPRLSRKSGRYVLEVKGNNIECTSLKELLAEGLKALEAYRQGTLDQLAGIKPRTKRIVVDKI